MVVCRRYSLGNSDETGILYTYYFTHVAPLQLENLGCRYSIIHDTCHSCEAILFHRFINVLVYLSAIQIGWLWIVGIRDIAPLTQKVGSLTGGETRPYGNMAELRHIILNSDSSEQRMPTTVGAISLS